MQTYLNEITGIADAIVSMYMSKKNWTRELELGIRSVCSRILDSKGKIITNSLKEDQLKYNEWMVKLTKWGCNHITMLRFIDMSITVEGLHRAGQDDWDSHAARFNNRIIRNSTRLANFQYELSEWYQNKIIPTDIALAELNISIPEKIVLNGIEYIKSINGYIDESMKDDPDVKRGLYMLGIPSNFIFKVNLTEWAHVYKERSKGGHANPEVKLCCESISDQIESYQPLFNRELFTKINN